MLGFPEGWVDVKGVSRTAKIRMLGNAVQVQCGEAIGHLVMDHLEKLDR
jgi:site-specific DNA-cytosine methylase